MAAPLKARGAKSLANLKQGGAPGKKKGDAAVEKEARRISRKLLNDPAYRKTLIKRLRAGTIQPGVEALLWHYSFGKPKETIETNPVVPVKIVHQFADDEPAKEPKPKK